MVTFSSTCCIVLIPDSASFTFRAWDQSSGSAGALADTSVNGGQTPFSTATDSASITVTSVNDAPVLAGADVSVAMGAGTTLAQSSADAVLLGDSLAPLLTAVELSRRTRRIIRQNIAWAIGYNVLAVPLAASGMLAPWMAAIGMSASSLLVVINALRLTRRRHTPDKVASSRPATVAAG